MSWLRGAFDKVRERSSTVKVIAKDVAHLTREVRTRLTGTSSAADLQVCIINIYLYE